MCSEAVMFVWMSRVDVMSVDIIGLMVGATSCAAAERTRDNSDRHTSNCCCHACDGCVGDVMVLCSVVMVFASVDASCL